MLLNTWLSVARRHFGSANSRRVDRVGKKRSVGTEPLEERLLLAGTPVVLNALVINPDNVAQYTNSTGGIVVGNSQLTGKDALVIEGISVATSTGDAISVNLSGIALKRLAIETVTVSQYTNLGVNISLTNVTGMESIALEDIVTTGTKRGLSLTLNNTDTNALTIDDSTFPGVTVTATNGADIHNGVVTGNKISAPAGVEGVILNVISNSTTTSTANDFKIIDNIQITTLDRDAVQVNATGYYNPTTRVTTSSLDGLNISNNTIGAAEGANASFRAEGDTFVQPFTLKNNATQGELLRTFVLDLTQIGLEFDVDATTGKPFTALNGSGTVVGVSGTTLSADKKQLTVNFTDFNPGETLQFVIDVDLAGGIPTSVFGNQLIGADVSIDFSGNKNVAGQMAGDPDDVSASQFLVGAGVAGSNHGIHLNANALPLTNLKIADNVVTGVPGHSLYLDAKVNSDITGEITGNQFSSSGRDGINFGMVDSNFYGSVEANNIANNGGNGISILPKVTRSGLVQSATSGSASSPIVITSANHGLQTGDTVIVQGIPNAKLPVGQTPINFPGNGTFTVTRTGNNTFSLNGTNVAVAGALALKAGAWYVPDFRGGGMTADSARGFVQIDLKAGAAPKAITAASNTQEIAITSAGHGLKSGDIVRVTGVQGNTAANTTAVVSVTSANVFVLRGVVGSGSYTTGGTWVPLNEAAPNGDIVPKGIVGNTITGNTLAGIYSDSTVGTTVRADVVQNTVSLNDNFGIQFESHSYGLGTSLPLSPTDTQDLPDLQDYGFNVNIGTETNGQGNTGGGNTLHQNKLAGIALEALDYGTGGFEAWNNTITSTQDDNNASTPYSGDGIFVRLKADLFSAVDATAVLATSVIKQNVIGVDNLGNEGNGLLFDMGQRTRIQNLDVVSNNFLNNTLDGFHFERREDATVNKVVISKNNATNNGSDGVSLAATNTSRNQLDFTFTENVLSDNDTYGLRLDVSTDARIDLEFSQNTVTGNGASPSTVAGDQGYHPADGTGNAGKAGGIGVFAFQQTVVKINGTNNIIDGNIGDGFSVDAFNFFDSLKLDMTLSNTTFNSNTLTGYRSHGASFGTLLWTENEFSSNGEDGVRFAAIDDKNDFYERRVGGQDISIRALKSHFNSNGANGARLGQGVSAAFGDGTEVNANTFDSNTVDGLKITQSAGAYMAQQNSLVGGTGLEYEYRRHIGANLNYFRDNGGDGIDIGHFAQTEGGNVELGDEVITDTHVSVNQAIITNNGGDGIEYLADSQLRLPPVIGGGQDGFALKHNSSLSVSNSRISDNAKRGIDILNRVGEDSAISIIHNQILSNKGEAIYVLNTASHVQLQNDSSDPLDAYLEDIATRREDLTRYFTVSGKQREVTWEISPNIELRVQDNVVQSNGSLTGTSTVPITESTATGDSSGVPNTDWTHNFQQITGTLGGLVIRVGAVDSSGRFTRANDGSFPGGRDYADFTANPNWELGLSGIDAEVIGNAFDGNVGADVYVDSFTSQIPYQTDMEFGDGDDPRLIEWLKAGHQGYRDPLARLNMVFRENIGNSIDVTNGFAFLDNDETIAKRRNPGQEPPGHFSGVGFFRNQQRTMGFFNDVGDDFVNQLYYGRFFTTAGVYVGNYSYDGWGTSTFRVESDFESNNFTQSSPSLGFSDFYDSLDLSINNANVQWDTGTNVGAFVGDTPWSLDRGDVFNVGAGLAPIAADSLDSNDSFIGATDLGVVSGSGFDVNALAANNALSLHTKRDRDYYSFEAGGTGSVNINVGNTDATGDQLVYMLYEIDPDSNKEESPLVQAANGDAQFVVVAPGGTGVLTANVVAGRRYAIEVFSDEAENVVDRFTVIADPLSNAGKLAKFHYGTIRTYTVSIDAPALAPPSGGGGGGGGGGAGGGGGSGGGGGGGSTIPQGGSVPGAPTVINVGPVTPSTRSVAIGDVFIEFSEDVTGFDISDLKLTRGGVNVPLTGLVVTPINAAYYSVNLGSVTASSGTYVLTLTATSSGIRDTDSVLLVTGGSTSWSVNNTVTSLLDTPDTYPGDGVASDIGGNKTLRAAVMESNTSFGDDVINLGAGTYTLTAAGRFEDEALTGDLDIHGNLTIRGVSAASTIIDAALIDRVFHVFAGATLTLQNLTIKNGFAFDGGGIFNEGSLVLYNVNVRCNTAGNQGGGIYNAGSLGVVGSNISENLAGSRGGAVHNLGSSSYLNTTISSNVAVSRGGGIFNEGSVTASMINTTIVLNAAGSRGGGIASESATATSLGNSLIERNKTDAKVPTTLASTFQDLMGGVQSLGYNSVQVLDARYATGNAAGLIASDKFGRDATPRPVMTNALQFTPGNGVGHHSLKPTGAAVDAGSNSVYPGNPLGQLDAIGNPRLIEGNGDGIITIDLGAVEHLVNTPVALFTATPNPTGLNEIVTFNGSTSTHPNPAAGSIVLWEWDFDWNPNNVAPTKPLTDPTYNPYENFTQDTTGVSPTHAYSNPARTSYIVRLIVTDNFGNKGFKDTTVTVAPPTKPVVSRPFPVTTDLTPTITWQGSPAKYGLKVDKVVVVSNVITSRTNVINLSNLTSTSYTPSSNLAIGRYEVTVTSTNGSGTTTSNLYYFDITQLNLTTPTGSTFDTTPVFNWGAVAGTSRYDVWVNQTAPTFKNQVIRNQFVPTNSYESPTTLGQGTYTWWVRAYDADGVAGAWSSSKTFTIDRATITSPAKVTLNTKPTFIWTNLGAPRYELWVNQAGGTEKIIYKNALTTNSFTATTALPNGTYDVWVRPLAADGEAGLWSLGYRFQMDYRVGPVTFSPVGVTTDTTPTFTWQAIDGAANYDLFVNNTTTGVSQVIRRIVAQVNGVTNITYTSSTALKAGNYRWWVQAINSAGARTAWSSSRDFQIPVPSFFTPQGVQTTSTPLFSWSGVAEFATYDLWVDNISTGVNQVIRVQGLTNKFYAPTLPLEDGQFRAWVRGFDQDGKPSEWSAFSDFTVSAAISNAPITLTPKTTIVDNTPTFMWTGVSNAARYEILVKDMSENGQPTVLNIKTIVGTSYTTTATLAPNRNYRWWVRAITSNNENGPWSQPQDFRVVSSELPIPSDPAGPIESNQLASVVLTAYAENGFNDGFLSVSAHPVGTVLQVTPEAAADLLAASDAVTEVAQPIAEIDAVMEELALTAFFMGDHDAESELSTSGLVTAPVVISDDSTGTDRQDNRDILVAGLLAAVTLPRAIPNKSEKRKVQR
jgi:hypothetical protein